MVDYLKRLDARSLLLSKTIGVIADAKKAKAYLVGGPVRDLILKRPTQDLDIVIEGRAMDIAGEFAKAVGGKCTVYPAFKTATVTLPDGRAVDLVTARQEKYPKPGVFPVVAPSNIKDDLYRRDFTVNAMAIGINPSSLGVLVDPYDGMKDLKAKKIRVLHDKSFLDDPTRILRAARFSGRLGFSLERHTLKLLNVAVESGALKTIKGQRWVKEMAKIEKEKNRTQMMKCLKEWGIRGGV